MSAPPTTKIRLGPQKYLQTSNIYIEKAAQSNILEIKKRGAGIIPYLLLKNAIIKYLQSCLGILYTFATIKV